MKYFKRIDRFGSGVNFKFGEESSYQSICGAILSIVVFILLLIQLNEKVVTLMNRDDTKHSSRVEFGMNLNYDPIGYKETGLNFAFGIFPLDYSATGIIPELEISDYVDIQAATSEFKIAEDGTVNAV